MLKSYAAVYKKGHLNWLDDIPVNYENAQVIVTFMESSQKTPEYNKHQILEQAWGCIKQPKSCTQIDLDIAQMRSEWNER